MFQLAHAAWASHPHDADSSLAHALGFDYPAFLPTPLPPPPAMQSMAGVLIPGTPPPPPPPVRGQSVKPEPAEPSLQHGPLVYVFEHARRTADGAISFDLCDEESLLAQPAPAPAPPVAATAPARGMKAMMGVFRVNPFTGPGPRGERLPCDGGGGGEEDSEEEEDGDACDGGERVEFRLDMTQHSHLVTQRRDAHAHANAHTLAQGDLRHALPPFISAACSSASPSSSSTLGSMDSQHSQHSHSQHSQHSHSQSLQHHGHHSRPSTAASSHSGSGSSFTPSSLTLTPTPSHSAASQPDAGASSSSKKKPKKVKMHACDVCHKEFPRPSGLQTHMNVHSGAKPYKCPVPGCSKRFGVRSNATRHLRVHQRQQAHAAAQQQQAAAAQRAPAVPVSDQWLDLPDSGLLRPTPADVLAAQQQQQQSQRWVPDSLQHLTNALELPTAQRGPRVEAGPTSLPDAGEWPYHPSQVSSASTYPSVRGPPAETTKQWASKLPGPGPLRQQWAQPSHAWVGA